MNTKTVLCILLLALATPAMACYGMAYSCDVYCRNTDLNMTAATNGTISGWWWTENGPDTRCQVTNCELTDRTDSMGFSTMHLPATSTINANWFIVGVIIIAALCLVYASYIHQRNKEKKEEKS